MSIKSDNSDLKEKIKLLKEEDEFLNKFIKNIALLQKKYDLLISNYNNFCNLFVDAKSLSSPENLDENAKKYIVSITSNIKELNSILNEYNLAIPFGNEIVLNDTFFTSPGQSVPTPNYKDTLSSIVSSINAKINKINDKVDIIKSNSESYKTIITQVKKSKVALRDAHSHYKNNEIEVKGDKKIAKFKRRIDETADCFVDFNTALRSIREKIEKVKKIEIKKV